MSAGVVRLKRPITTTVHKCARCGETHDDLTFMPLTRPITIVSMFAINTY